MIVIWNQAKKLAHATLALGVVAGGIVLTQSAPASAASGDCSARKDVKIRDWQPDDIRVIARCTHIAGGTQARGYLDMLGCCDKETTWFTTINKDYYSAYASGNFESVGINLRDV
ncbi:hypothetical protein KBX71_27120 [Micromonospora sp. D93]|uniref:hypothetical protein n=1 Tax=Micromonospora sp. D93 TaxID=2824886 RepID=UPI001B38F3BE|nr:hypothetical protein [Micromonospora sp. D93]MBQ1021526.1 hypothetical protein [Micromonospora sp. D93]